MAIKRISPQEAAELQAQGWIYVDIRSEPEFENGRPAGSVNIPLFHRSALGPTPNTEFLAAMRSAYPPDSKFILGCQSGNRSLRAAELLLGHGYAEILEQQGGFAGWSVARLPSETGPAPGRDWASLKPKG